jgi:hypothetical protein
MLKPYFGGLRHEVAMFWVLETSTNKCHRKFNNGKEEKKPNMDAKQNIYWCS